MESIPPLTNSPLTIYIAEDHLAIREMLARHLDSLSGYRVVGQTSDGRDVAPACVMLKPKLLILDIGLDAMNGIQVARAVTEAAPHTNILIFSSHHDAATVRRVMEAGAKGMVEKAGSFDVLMRAIDAVGQGRAYFGDAVTQAMQSSFLDPHSTRSLTARENEVLQLVAQGRSNKEISSQLNISLKTAENHRHNLMRKLDAHNSADLTREAFRRGLIQADQLPGAGP